MATRHLDCATLPLLPGQFATLAGPVGRALEEIGVAAYVLDRSGEIVWMNRRARELFGDRVGRLYTETVAPDSALAARTAFVKKISGTESHTREVGVLYTADGARILVEIDAVAMRCNADIVGVFGVISIKNTRPQPAAVRREQDAVLTPRQLQVLREMAHGASTDEIASLLSLSRTTVCNHIARAMAALGAHTRLQAVIHAQRRGLIA